MAKNIAHTISSADYTVVYEGNKVPIKISQAYTQYKVSLDYDLFIYHSLM